VIRPGTRDLDRARRRFKEDLGKGLGGKVRRVIRDFKFEGVLAEEEAMFTELASLMTLSSLTSWSSWGDNTCV